MPKGLTPKQEKAWERAKKVVKKEKGKKTLKKKDWPLVVHITKEMAKSASSVRIEPFESLVDRAVKIVEQELGSGALSKVKTIILEPNQSDHYGQVHSDEADTIYLSFSRIKSELANKGDDEVVRQLAQTIVHELGHLEADFKGGEGPAESKAQNFISRYDSRQAGLAHIQVASIVKLAHELDIAGHTVLADFCDCVFDQVKIADLRSRPNEFIASVVGVIRYLADGVKPEGRKKYLWNFENRLGRLVAQDLAGRNKNPGAGIGAVSSLMKNILAGQHPATINNILRKIVVQLRSL
jgi:hypothetical protein